MYIIQFTTQEILCKALLYFSALWHRESHPIYFIESISFKYGGDFIGLNYYQSLLLLMLLLAALADLRTDRIPNGFIVLGMIIGLSGSLWADKDLWKSIGSMLLAFLLLYPIYKIGAMGAGDVKLFIMIGGFYGVKEFMVVLAGAFVIGAVFSLFKLFTEHNGKERMQYFCSYMSEVMQTRKWKLYGENLLQDYEMYRRNKIHFAVPILFSVVLKTGGLF